MAFDESLIFFSLPSAGFVDFYLQKSGKEKSVEFISNVYKINRQNEFAKQLIQLYYKLVMKQLNAIEEKMQIPVWISATKPTEKVFISNAQ